MKIVKHSGDIVDFNREKLRQSLLKSGANDVMVDDVLKAIEEQIFEGISTQKIYKLAFSMLKRIPGAHAARYNLRTAIQQLGPAGFFFENSSQGYFYQKATKLLQTSYCKENVFHMR